MKESLVRSFSMIDSETFKCSSRSEWPAMLHNICYIHSAIRLRSRFNKAGFNSPDALGSVGTQEFLVRIYSFSPLPIQLSNLDPTSTPESMRSEYIHTHRQPIVPCSHLLNDILYGLLPSFISSTVIINELLITCFIHCIYSHIIYIHSLTYYTHTCTSHIIHIHVHHDLMTIFVL